MRRALPRSARRGVLRRPGPDSVEGLLRIIAPNCSTCRFLPAGPAGAAAVAGARGAQSLVAEVPIDSPAVETLRLAVEGCRNGTFDAMVTAPVHKGVINDAGVPFQGHTEYLAGRLGCRRPVMLLVAGDLRVAVATTHLPLRRVPDALSRELLAGTLEVLDAGLRERFRIERPRILVCGLTPHAGQSGHLGSEEIDVIAPAVAAARDAGIDARGPLPADTAFTPASLAGVDAVLAMFHDQGLPVLKHAGFGRGVNITLGLPIVRTSVDHGTALDLAATGRADPGSLRAALDLATWIAG